MSNSGTRITIQKEGEKEYMKTMRHLMASRKGFTLIEIMIVVLIIGVLLAIAVPSFVTARTTSRQNACIKNLRAIEASKDQWCMATNHNTGDTCAWTDLTPTYLKAQPACPGGGAYTIGVVGTNATCTIAGHVQ